MRGASRPISITARHQRATGAASGAKSWPLPSPPRITHASAFGAEAVERGDRRADVGALAVVEGIDAVDAARSTSTRCGSPRYSRRPCSIGASGQPIARGERQRGQRVDRVVPAADAQRIGRHQALRDDLRRGGGFVACDGALARARRWRRGRILPQATRCRCRGADRSRPRAPARPVRTSPRSMTLARGPSSRGVVAVEHAHRPRAEDARLGGRVGVHRRRASRGGPA